MLLSSLTGVLLACAAAASPLFDHGVQDIDVDTLLRSKRQVPRTHKRHEWHEVRHVVGWKKEKRADTAALLPMRIGLAQSNTEKGHQKLMEISDPKSPNYGKHLNLDEVTEMFAPSNETVDAVKSWLASSGIAIERIEQSTNRQWLAFDAPVWEAEKLLFADYHIYVHGDSGVRNVACSEYHIPEALREHIDYITPGIKLMAAGRDERILDPVEQPAARKRQVESDIAETDAVQATFQVTGGCDSEVTLSCVRNQYSVPKGKRAIAGNELGVFQSLGYYYHQDDLDMYYDNFAKCIPRGTHPELRSINGATGPTQDLATAGMEADMDFEITIPIIWPQKTVLFQTDDPWYEAEQATATTQYLGFFNTFFDALDGSYCKFEAFGETGNCVQPDCRDPVYPNPNPGGYKGNLMCGVYKPTNIISISYSGIEHTLPYAYMQRQCLEIMKLSLQGITIMESSGDFGVGGSRNDPQQYCLGPSRDVFAPRTMSNCPYVLSVGATSLVNDTKTPGKYIETAAQNFASGGGFSNVFETPDWQRDHVRQYLNRTNLFRFGYDGGGWNYSNVGAQPGKLFNLAGRGYPDVSAIGSYYRVFTRGYANRVSGTSVAVPVWSSLLTLINEERLAKGKSTVGFIHPVIYAHPEAFNDIMVGSNPGCGGSGFVAKEGWDPLTGLGSPNYPKLLQVFMSLP